MWHFLSELVPAAQSCKTTHIAIGALTHSSLQPLVGLWGSRQRRERGGGGGGGGGGELSHPRHQQTSPAGFRVPRRAIRIGSDYTIHFRFVYSKRVGDSHRIIRVHDTASRLRYQYPDCVCGGTLCYNGGTYDASCDNKALPTVSHPYRCTVCSPKPDQRL